MREHPKYGEGLESFPAITEVVSVRFQRKTRLIRLMAVEFSGSLDQTATRYRCVFRVTNCSSPTFLPPFAPHLLRRFITTMEALTPVHFSPTYRSPCFTYSPFLTIPSPTTWCPLSLLYSRYVVLSPQGAQQPARPTLGGILRTFKSISAILLNRILSRTGGPLWQRNYYEHIIRNERSLNAIREYILNNPNRWSDDPNNPESCG